MIKSNAVLVISIFFLVGCGIHKKREITKKEHSHSENIAAKAIVETTHESVGELRSVISSDFLNFNIEPVTDVANFSFLYNGNKIEGTTTGKLNFTNEKKEAETKIKWTYKVHTTYRTETTYKTNTYFKTIDKVRYVDKNITFWNWLMIIAITILLWEILKTAIFNRHKILNLLTNKK